VGRASDQSIRDLILAGTMRHTLEDEIRVEGGLHSLLAHVPGGTYFFGLTLWPTSQQDKELLVRELAKGEEWVALRLRPSSPDFELFDIAFVLREADEVSIARAHERWVQVLQRLPYHLRAKEIAGQYFGASAPIELRRDQRSDWGLSVGAAWTEAAKREGMLGNLSYGPPGQERIFLAESENQATVMITDAELSEHTVWYSFGDAGLSSDEDFLSLCRRLGLERRYVGKPTQVVLPAETGAAAIAWQEKDLEIGFRYSSRPPSAMWCLMHEDAYRAPMLQMWCWARDKGNLPVVMRSTGRPNSETDRCTLSLVIDDRARAVGLPPVEEFRVIDYVAFDFARK